MRNINRFQPGNYVKMHVKNEHVYEWFEEYEMSEENILMQQEFPELFKAITLREYHLKKFGFLNGNRRNEYVLFFWNKKQHKMRLQLFYDTKTENYECIVRNVSKDLKGININIDFVHELQNIHNIISNEKLKLGTHITKTTHLLEVI